MIIDKRPLPDDPEPTDAPPAYEAGSTVYPLDKARPPQPSASGSSLVSPISPPPLKSPNSFGSHASPSGDKGKARANWFNFAAARTSREVRQTVLGLIRDLVQEHLSNSPAATGILRSCADACSSHDVSLSEILQQKSIEDHTPLYWAIVKRLPDGHQDVEDNLGPDLLSALISYASPLNKETIREVRLACLATSDQKLFQRLRLSPEFARMSGTDQMLLGVAIPLDEIEVEDISSDGGTFAATFVIPQFHKRMVVSKEIALEFIARSRMWRLAFYIASNSRSHGDPPDGSWCISLSLLEVSPPTFVDSQLLIPAVSAAHGTVLPSPTALLSLSDPGLPPSPPQSALDKIRSSKSSKLDPTIALRLKTTAYEQLESPGRYQSGNKVVVALEKSLMGAKLQYENNPYIGPDKALRARFEARLGKPEAECIIC